MQLSSFPDGSMPNKMPCYPLNCAWFTAPLRSAPGKILEPRGRTMFFYLADYSLSTQGILGFCINSHEVYIIVSLRPQSSI